MKVTLNFKHHICTEFGKHVVYECDICDCLHPWDWNGDCRDDANRYFDPLEYAEKHGIPERDVEVRSMGDRLWEDAHGDDE